MFPINEQNKTNQYKLINYQDIFTYCYNNKYIREIKTFEPGILQKLWSTVSPEIRGNSEIENKYEDFRFYLFRIDKI